MGKRSQLRNATPLNLLFSKHYFDDDTESECDGLLSGSFADRIAEELLRDNASEESEQPTFASPISNQELNIAIADVGKVPIDDKSVHIKLLWALIAKQQEVISKGDGPGKRNYCGTSSGANRNRSAKWAEAECTPTNCCSINARRNLLRILPRYRWPRASLRLVPRDAAVRRRLFQTLWIVRIFGDHR